MKPSSINTILDLAQEARKINEPFIPLFTGEAGLGKSAVCQQWVSKQRERNPNFGFLDIRIAYYEAPDLIGLPETEILPDGTRVTMHYVPEMWPRDMESEGLLLFEEPNRGTTGVMNCLMQILTDRIVNGRKIPPKWIIASCINPDSAEYDVNAMDAALKDRFEHFDVEFDALTFIEFMESQDWHPNVQMFVKSGVWTYKDTKSLGKGEKYISPRTWSKMNAAEKAGGARTRALHRLLASSILGKDIGNEYHKFCFDQAPVTASDLLKDKDSAITRLKSQSDRNSYQGDMIAATCESIIKVYGGLAKDCKDDQINEDIMAEVAAIIPADHAVALIKECGFKQSRGKITTFFPEFTQRHPELAQILRDSIRLTRSTTAKKPTEDKK